MNRVEALKREYALEAHPEGGCFSEVYEAPDLTAQGRPFMGSIYFLLEGDEISHLHVIDCDELWYYHEGCGMRVTLVDAGGRVSFADLPRGVTFGAENLDPAGYSFVSCATAPRFTYEGFTLVSRERLAELCPDAPEAVARLAMGE